MSESFSDTVSSYVKERLTNPVLVSFSIAWSLYNYRFYVVLFSNNTVSQTFSLLHDRFPDFWSIVIHGFIFPCLFAAVYLFASPYVTAWYYEWLKDRQKKVDDAKYAIESAQRLTEEESRNIRASAREKDTQIDKLEADISRLKDDLKAADQKLNVALEKDTSAADRVAEAEKQLAVMQQERREIEQRSEASLRTLKDLLDLSQKSMEAESERAKEADAKRADIEKQLTTLRSEISTPPTITDEERIGELDVDQFRILEFVGNNPLTSAWSVAEGLALNRLEADYWVQQLVDKNYLEFQYESDSVSGLAITQLGRHIWMMFNKR